jgi:hypothetical protein
MPAVSDTTKITVSQIKLHRPDLAFISPRSWTRWTQRPTRGHTLESIRIGGRLFVTLKAVDEFIAALNAAPESALPAPRSPSQRQRASQQAAAELEAAGA